MILEPAEGGQSAGMKLTMFYMKTYLHKAEHHYEQYCYIIVNFVNPTVIGY